MELIEKNHYERKKRVYERVAGIVILSATAFWNIEGIVSIVARSIDYLDDVQIYIIAKVIISFCCLVCFFIYVKITRIREGEQEVSERKRLIWNVILLILFISLWIGSYYINWKAEGVYFRKLEEVYF